MIFKLSTQEKSNEWDQKESLIEIIWQLFIQDLNIFNITCDNSPDDYVNFSRKIMPEYYLQK